MKKMSYKSIIIVYIILLYFAFSGIIFVIYSNYYMKNMKNEFIEQNNYAAKVASDMIAEERIRLSIGARIIASDDFVYNALKNKIYLENKTEIGKEYIKIRTKEITLIDYKNMVNILRNKIYGTGRGSEETGVAVYDEKFELVGYSSFFIKKFLDTGKEKYIRDSFGEQNLGGVEINLIEKRGDDFYIKGIAPVGKNTRYLYENPYGVVVVGKKIDGEFLSKIKKTINRELIIFAEDRIINSTMYNGGIRVENVPVSIIKAAGDETYFFSELLIEGKNMGVTFFPVKDYFGQTIAYVGTGNYYDGMERVYKEGIIRFIKFEIIISLAMIIIFFIFLRRLFKPFYRVLNRIKDIKEGNYDKKIYMKKEREELQLMIDSINSLAETVKKREQELLYLNEDLEDKVLMRTRELHDKNNQLQTLIGEIKKVNRKMNEEIHAAKKIHSKISAFIDPKLKNYNIKYENISVTGIGGDFVETIFLNNGKKGLFFADVAGHGVAAALMVSALKIIISLYFKDISKPSEALYVLNNIINENFIEGITVSAVYVLFDEQNDTAEISISSQEDVFIISDEGVSRIKEKGIILGVLDSDEIRKSDELRYKDICLRLKKGEKIFLYTDGLVEKEILTRESLIEVLKNHKSRSSEIIMEYFSVKINPVIRQKEKDDVTYLIVEKSC